jgi:hypothetical protein
MQLPPAAKWAGERPRGPCVGPARFHDAGSPWMGVLDKPYSAKPAHWSSYTAWQAT